MEHSSQSRVRHPDESQVVNDNAGSAGLQLKPVRFEFTHPRANTVCVAGTFNYWHSEAKTMHSLGKGRWVKRTVLRTGTYEYCLVVDREWKPDPLAKETVRMQGFEAHTDPTNLVADRLLGLVKRAGVERGLHFNRGAFQVLHARYLCLKLSAPLLKQKIVVGLWDATENPADAARRLRDFGADEVLTTLADAVRQLAKLAPSLAEQMTPAKACAVVSARN